MYKIEKMTLAFVSLLSLGLASGCNAGAGSEDEASRFTELCGDRGASSGDPCPISFLTLAANPDLFNERYVRVAGYYSEGLDHLLFVDRNSADGGVVANAALLSMRTKSELEGLKPEHLILIEAKFLHSVPTRGEFDVPKTRGLLGELADAKRIRGSAIGLPYKCWGLPAEESEISKQDADCL